MNPTVIPFDSPVAITADNAEPVLAAVSAFAKGALYRLTVNGTEQDGFYTLNVGITTDQRFNPHAPQRTVKITMAARSGTASMLDGVTPNPLGRFPVQLRVADLDGSAPGTGRAALQVELRKDAITLRTTEPAPDQFVDAAYDLTFADHAATPPAIHITFADPSDDLEHLTATLAAHLDA